MDDSHLDVAMAAYRRAVGLLGGQVSFEKATNIRQQTTSYRLRNRIPLQSAAEVMAVESATGVSRHDLRPDLYPREDSLAHPPAGGPPPPPAGGSRGELEEARL